MRSNKFYIREYLKTAHTSCAANSTANAVCRAFAITLIFVAFIAPLTAMTLEGRLPGERFLEDNPPRFGAVMSFVSRSHSLVLVDARVEKPNYIIAKLLNKIARSFKINRKELKKVTLVEGEMRWLQYTFRKGAGGGFFYVTRQENVFVYVLIYNFSYDALANDMPFVDRYIQELQLVNDEQGTPP